MSEVKRISPPLSDDDVVALVAGDRVLINGVLYTGRDAAHKRMVEALDRGESLPFDPQGQIIYFVGPTPAKPGQVIGSAGPTTSYRMDAYAPYLLARGLKGMIGKGFMGPEVQRALVKFKAIYLSTVGGAGANKRGGDSCLRRPRHRSCQTSRRRGFPGSGCLRHVRR